MDKYEKHEVEISLPYHDPETQVSFLIPDYHLNIRVFLLDCYDSPDNREKESSSQYKPRRLHPPIAFTSEDPSTRAKERGPDKEDFERDLCPACLPDSALHRRLFNLRSTFI